MPPTSPTPPARFRIRLRISLRFLLATLTLLCLALALWTHRAREQRRFVERIRNSGGAASHKASYYYRVPHRLRLLLGEDFFFRVVRVEVKDLAIARELHKFRRIEFVELRNTMIDDEAIQSLSRLPKLQMLCVDSDEGHEVPTQVGDASLEWIGRMPNLKYVRVDAHRLSSLGIRALARSRSLQIIELYCDECSIDADALAQLRGVERIAALRIWKRSDAAWEQVVEWDPKNAL